MNRQLLNRSTSVATQASPNISRPTNAMANIPPAMDKIYLHSSGPSHDPHSTSNDSLLSSSDTSNKISKLLLSSPNTAASAKKVPSDTKLRRSSLSQQMHMRKVSTHSSSSSLSPQPSEKYRRAAQSLQSVGLLYLDKRNDAQNVTTTDNEARKSVLVAKDNNIKQSKHQARRDKVSFSEKVIVVVIERLSAADSKAMHTTNEEALELQKDAIHTAKTLRHLTKHYGHDVAVLRAQAFHLQVDTCIRGIEHFLSKQLFRERNLTQMRHVDTVLDTQHRYRQYANALQQARTSSSPTQLNIFVEAMAGDIAKTSKSMSRTTVLDAINRAVEDEVEAARSLAHVRSGFDSNY